MRVTLPEHCSVGEMIDFLGQFHRASLLVFVSEVGPCMEPKDISHGETYLAELELDAEQQEETRAELRLDPVTDVVVWLDDRREEK